MISEIKELAFKILQNDINADSFVINQQDDDYFFTCMNINHTILFKIKFKPSMVEPEIPIPGVLPKAELYSEEYNFGELTEYFSNMINFFNEDLFNPEGYVETSTLQFEHFMYKSLYHGCDISLIRINDVESALYTSNLKLAYLDESNELSLKLLSPDSPLYMHYQFNDFDVYVVIAPVVREFHEDQIRNIYEVDE